MEKNGDIMDMIKYEKFEEWLSILKAADKKTTTIYIDVIRVKPTETRISMNIIFQIRLDNLIHSCIITEEMPELTIVPDWVFSVLSTEKLRNDALADYHHQLDEYDRIVHDEYQKACDIIKNLGYTNIIMGLIQ